jgi:alkylation response protein AidB-like acyl-CoA dehydrogenase
VSNHEPFTRDGILEAATKLAVEFSDRAAAIDESGDFPVANMEALKDHGLLTLAVPSEYGGNGTQAGHCTLDVHQVVEKIAAGCATTAWCLVAHYHACGVLAGLGNDEQQGRIFHDVVQNGALLATVGSEVNASSTAGSERQGATAIVRHEATMEPSSTGFKVSGRKGFASIAPYAKYILYWALAPGSTSNSDGLVVSVIPAASRGVSFLPGWEKAIGIRGSASGGALFEDVDVPWTDVLGNPGDFIQIHNYTFDLTYAAHLAGIAQGAYEYVRSGLAQREFLQDDGYVLYVLGEMRSSLQSSKASWRYAQTLWDQERYQEAHQATLRALHQCKLSAMDITTRGFEVTGVRGLFRPNPLERGWRDARTVSLHTRESTYMGLVARAELTGSSFVKEKYGERLGHEVTWESLGFNKYD